MTDNVQSSVADKPFSMCTILTAVRTSSSLLLELDCDQVPWLSSHICNCQHIARLICSHCQHLTWIGNSMSMEPRSPILC